MYSSLSLSAVSTSVRFCSRFPPRWLATVGALAWGVVSVPAAAPVLSNVTAAQRAGTKLVDVTYDLADPDTTTLTVSLLVSPDGGSTWTVPVAGNTGHVGTGVAPGLRKVVTWNAGTNWDHQFSTTMRFRVTADDGTITAPPGFVLIPSGSFQMGNSTNASEGDPDELPVHTVTVSAFYMGTTKATYAQWQSADSYATANGYTFDNARSGQASNHPVHTVSWYDAVKWCNAKSQQEGLMPCYTVNGATYKTGRQSGVVCNFTSNGYRLPTEAEWEKAARGGLSAQRFPWGATITHTQANYYSTSDHIYDISPTRGHHPAYWIRGYPYTSPVGAFAANAYGLDNMSGNLSEWCWDLYSSNYNGAGANDPRGAALGSLRVVRGGDWDYNASSCRAANRSGDFPSGWDYYVGFRLARGSSGGQSAVASADSPNTTVDARDFRITAVKLTDTGDTAIELKFISQSGATYRVQSAASLHSRHLGRCRCQRDWQRR